MELSTRYVIRNKCSCFSNYCKENACNKHVLRRGAILLHYKKFNLIKPFEYFFIDGGQNVYCFDNKIVFFLFQVPIVSLFMTVRKEWSLKTLTSEHSF